MLDSEILDGKIVRQGCSRLAMRTSGINLIVVLNSASGANRAVCEVNKCKVIISARFLIFR